MELAAILFSGIIGSVITAIATIVAPVVAHRYTVTAISSSDTQEAIPPLASRFAKLFQLFDIPQWKEFKIRDKNSFIHPSMDLTVSCGPHPHNPRHTLVVVTLPGSETGLEINNPHVGWSTIFECDGINYRLSLLSKQFRETTFSLRRLK